MKMLYWVTSIFIFIACSTGSEKSLLEAVDISLVEGGVLIINNSTLQIGYFAVDQAALLDWATTCTDSNLVTHGKGKLVYNSDISGFNPGNNIDVYFWECPLDEAPEVYNKVLTQ